MPQQNIHVVSEVGTLEEAFDALAKLQKTLRYLLNGNLDFENVRVKGLTAETIDVNELSAITANLGTIIAGIINGVEIYGSYISTGRGTYPRAEMSSTGKSFTVYKDANNYIQYNADYAGSPSINIVENGTLRGQIVSRNNVPYFSGTNGLVLSTASGDIQLNPATTGGRVAIGTWSRLFNTSSGRSLQDDLNSKANAFFGYSGSFETGDGRTVIVSNGIITGVV